MRLLRRSIPSGNLLYVFDAAARHESFLKAAAELNVTPAAVSHSIRQLESSLGVSLFERNYRQLRVTGAGAKLFQSIASGLDRIERTVEEIQKMRAPTMVRLHASITVATYSLLPHLARFRHHQTNMELRLYDSDRALDLPADGMSIAITAGRRDWDGYEMAVFARECVYPVCSPSYLSSQGPIDTVHALAKCNLLHLDEAYHDGMNWELYMDNFGADIQENGQRFIYNNYILVLHAALAGEGVALGWHHVVGDLVKSGQLVRPTLLEYSSDSDFYIVWRKACRLEEGAVALRDWLISIES